MKLFINIVTAVFLLACFAGCWVVASALTKIWGGG
jgi:hypothetical protein